ncbi:MAG TPA: FMN-binding protein [Thermoanaerobaculia bacterium]|nr:FMN-binding protein [Thermoanaerobaculia bacterium]
MSLAGAAQAKVFLTVDEALRLAFPGAEVERRTSYLTQAQRARAEELGGVDVPSRLVYRYDATASGRAAGTAYFDTHRVRTLPETVMVVLDAAGRVRRVEVLSFDEPPDYLPGGAWYGQFAGRGLDRRLALERDIRPITGATLTARATTAAVRRVLAVHRVLRESAE